MNKVVTVFFISITLLTGCQSMPESVFNDPDSQRQRASEAIQELDKATKKQ